ncbi:16S rRNA (guanine(527)-N(7))-methyltransferase RsmG [Chitinophaga pendula]|uniref:16S rRNA (guanine(527)-N(7))-methyltransferase RsmG n=1 Tax=Chitinophaga TaxID=79328 RepID=UPI000BAFC028|nr:MULTISPECIES: 16S rRNA (guanine(527)-N(7))-methyltransferase RsmG [Chitinophaga]ASZ14670.1 16S rRNA (guanine(527)-N(7))-methyltransferase RsmG [Chitinophaga sp. MD30]UCJ07676.1 16S rRNA (guanine(527)-N(7))-methyltransferase RsmG [Chitinophaga pendula]
MEIILKYFDDFSDTQMQQFQALGGLYKEWNEQINVISRKDIDALYEKHVLHSLAIAAIADFADGMTVLDLGTGGGFPGIPLAIFFPEVQFHLVDSIGKKIKVVEAVAEALQLRNVTTAHSRVEDVKRKFDTVVSRAVAPLQDLWKWSKPVLRKSLQPDLRAAQEERDFRGRLICLKGGDLAQEISESGCRPLLTDIFELFPEPYFEQKYVVVV